MKIEKLANIFVVWGMAIVTIILAIYGIDMLMNGTR